MKKALIIIVIVVIAALGYWMVRDEPAPAPVSAPEPATVPDDTGAADLAPVEEAPADPVADTPTDAATDTPASDAESIVDRARQDADQAAEAAEAAIADILESQEEAAAEAEARAAAAIEEALAAGDEAAAEAEATVGAAEQSMREQVEASEPATDRSTPGGTTDPVLLRAEADGVFTPEGFDFDRAVEAIDNSGIDPVDRRAARTLLESARDDPASLEAVLSQLRDMLGL